MCHSLNYYSAVENGVAAISSSLLLRNKILRTSLVLEVWGKKIMLWLKQLLLKNENFLTTVKCFI